MNIASTLLNAQRRPDAEALRVTTALAEAMKSMDDESALGAQIAVAGAFDRVNEEIANEKSPPRPAPMTGHLEQFGEPDPGPFSDSATGAEYSPSHRSDERYLLCDPDDDDSSVDVDDGDLPEAGEYAVTATGAPAEDDPDSGSHTPPCPDTEALRPRGLASAGESGSTPASATTPDGLGDGDGEALSAASVNGDAAPAAGNPSHDHNNDMEAPAVVPDADGETPDDRADTAQLQDQSGGDTGDQAGLEADSDPEVGDAPRMAWETAAAGAQPNSPWGNAQELVPTAMVTPPTDAGDPDSDDIGGGEFDDIGDRSDAASPRERATTPPADMDLPEPDPQLPLSDRLRVLAARLVSGKHKPFKLAGLGVGGIALVTVIALSFMGGGRGKPPTPAGQVAAPPTAVDNTPASTPDAPLIPATVSASCGNDSDAVGPFTGDRTRAWVCQRLNGLDLNVLNIQFSGPVVINSICVVPGFNYVAPDGRDEWARHRLVTAVTWRMGGASYDQQLTPTRTGVCQEFPSVITQEMSMTTTASTRPPLDENQNSGQFGGSGGDDPAKIDETTAISEIVITGHPVDPGAAAGPGQ